jgi:hypothetical protein
MQTASIDTSRHSKTPARDEADERRGPILAKTIYRELRSTGMSPAEVVSVATEMLALVAGDIRAQSSPG